MKYLILIICLFIVYSKQEHYNNIGLIDYNSLNDELNNQDRIQVIFYKQINIKIYN